MHWHLEWSDAEYGWMLVDADGQRLARKLKHDDAQALVRVLNSQREAVSRVVLLEGALAEAISIISGGRKPDSALNRKAAEWRELLHDGGQSETSLASPRKEQP